MLSPARRQVAQCVLATPLPLKGIWYPFVRSHLTLSKREFCGYWGVRVRLPLGACYGTHSTHSAVNHLSVVCRLEVR